MGIVIIMRGPPGSGKSTFVKRLRDAIVCSADNFFIDPLGNYKWDGKKIGEAHVYCQNQFLEAMKNKAGVIVVDNTNIKRDHYKFYVEKAHEAGYKVYQMVCKGTYLNKHGVALDKVEKMRASMEEDKDLPHYTSRASLQTFNDLHNLATEFGFSVEEDDLGQLTLSTNLMEKPNTTLENPPLIEFDEWD